jgi:hypothetical protein
MKLKDGRFFFIMINFVILQGCILPEAELKNTDNKLISYINNFNEQERVWAKSISTSNKNQAYTAVDSMHLILESLKQEDLERIHKKDSVYGASLENTFRMFEYVLDSIYPACTKIAFLNDKNYTFAEEKQLLSKIKRADSIMQHQLRKIQRNREIFRKSF